MRWKINKGEFLHFLTRNTEKNNKRLCCLYKALQKR